MAVMCARTRRLDKPYTLASYLSSLFFFKSVEHSSDLFFLLFCFAGWVFFSGTQETCYQTHETVHV